MVSRMHVTAIKNSERGGTAVVKPTGLLQWLSTANRSQETISGSRSLVESLKPANAGIPVLIVVVPWIIRPPYKTKYWQPAHTTVP